MTMQNFLALAVLALASPAWGQTQCFGDGRCFMGLGSTCDAGSIWLNGRCEKIMSMENAPGTITTGEDRSWHLLTQSEGGTVSLLKDLTKHECEFARDRVLNEKFSLGSHTVQPGEIKSAECFQ